MAAVSSVDAATDILPMIVASRSNSLGSSVLSLLPVFESHLKHLWVIDIDKGTGVASGSGHIVVGDEATLSSLLDIDQFTSRLDRLSFLLSWVPVYEHFAAYCSLSSISIVAEVDSVLNVLAGVVVGVKVLLGLRADLQDADGVVVATRRSAIVLGVAEDLDYFVGHVTLATVLGLEERDLVCILPFTFIVLRDEVMRTS